MPRKPRYRQPAVRDRVNQAGSKLRCRAATLVSQLNGVRLASEPGQWYGAKRSPVRRMGRQDGAGRAGHEFTGEVPQAIEKKWNSNSQNQNEQVDSHGPVLLSASTLNDERKSLKKYWISHEDSIKIPLCP